MDIRTKLALILVFVSLASMGLISLFAYKTSSELLQETSVRQLEGLAESKARDLSKVYQGWQDKLRLVRNGIELQASLASLIQDESDASHQQLTRILEHAALAVDGVERVTVVNKAGKEVCFVGQAQIYNEINLPPGKRDIVLEGAYITERNGLLVSFTTPLLDDDEVIGGLEIIFSGSDLEAMTTNYTGLDETGETMIVAPVDEASVLVLNSLRHEGLKAPGKVGRTSVSDPVSQVLAGKSDVFIKSAEDYRHKAVWAATRYLPELGWGVVVKIDASEENERTDFLRDAMFDIALGLSAFAIIGGTLLGFYLARPIHDLAVLVGRIREGETDLRAEVEGDDEIAFLGESLNELIDHLQHKSSKQKQAGSVSSVEVEIDESAATKNSEDPKRDA